MVHASRHSDVVVREDHEARRDTWRVALGPDGHGTYTVSDSAMTSVDVASGDVDDSTSPDADGAEYVRAITRRESNNTSTSLCEQASIARSGTYVVAPDGSSSILGDSWWPKSLF